MIDLNTDVIYNKISEIAEESELLRKFNVKLTLVENIGYHSIKMNNDLLFRLVKAKGQYILHIRLDYLNKFEPENSQIRLVKGKGDGFFRYTITYLNDIENMNKIIVFISEDTFLNTSVDAFGCCSRYVQCSDEKNVSILTILFLLAAYIEKILKKV